MTLNDFRVPGDTAVPPAKKGAKTPWQPLTPDRLGRGLVLAFDQSLRNTGWVFLRSNQAGCEVLGAGTCRTRAGDEPSNWNSTFADTVTQVAQIRAVLVRWRRDYPQCAVGHESPPTGGGQIRRPESAILAGSAIWVACDREGFAPFMLGNQVAKYLLTGRRTKVGKPDIAKAIDGLTWLRGRELLTNEHKRDATAVALAHLERLGAQR